MFNKYSGFNGYGKFSKRDKRNEYDKRNEFEYNQHNGFYEYWRNKNNGSTDYTERSRFSEYSEYIKFYKYSEHSKFGKYSKFSNYNKMHGEIYNKLRDILIDVLTDALHGILYTSLYTALFIVCTVITYIIVLAAVSAIKDAVMFTLLPVVAAWNLITIIFAAEVVIFIVLGVFLINFFDTTRGLIWDPTVLAINFMGTTLGNLGVAVGTIINTIISDVVGGTASTAVSGIMLIVDFIVFTVDSIVSQSDVMVPITKVKEFICYLIAPLESALSVAIVAALDFADLIMDFTTTAAGIVMDVISESCKTLYTLWGAVDEVIEATKGIVGTIIDAIGDAIGDAIEVVGGIILIFDCSVSPAPDTFRPGYILTNPIYDPCPEHILSTPIYEPRSDHILSNPIHNPRPTPTEEPNPGNNLP
jgi:hypothetical protein